MPGSYINMSAMPVLGDSVISINYNYKDVIVDVYINNHVHNYSWSLLGGSYLCSVILFQVW